MDPYRLWKVHMLQLLPFVFDVKLGRTNAPLVDRSVVLVLPLCLIVHEYYFPCYLSVFSLNFTIVLRNVLRSQPTRPYTINGVFFARHYISENRPGDEASNAGTHRERGIVALTRRLAKTKNQVRSETGVSRLYLAAVRAHNRALKAARQPFLKKSARIQEKNFRDNPMSFAKTVCKGACIPNKAPQFSANSAFQLNLFE